MNSKDKIQELMARATATEAQAREMRKEVGRLLAERQSRASGPGDDSWYRACGLDYKTAVMLIKMAVGGEVFGG